MIYIAVLNRVQNNAREKPLLSWKQNQRHINTWYIMVNMNGSLGCVQIYFLHTQLWFPASDHDFRRLESDFP